jgi:ribose transport system ATP-binding protein
MLQVRGLTKAYGPSTVLDDVSFEVPPHSIIGIVGENGAGKSTLFNILCGVTQPDAGEVRLGGARFRPRSLAEANRAGVSRVFQEQALIPSIRVYENLLLGHERLYSRGSLVGTRAMIDAAERILRRAGLRIDPRARTGDLDFSQRQMVEIARACFTPREVLGVSAGIVLLDEPTASLRREEESAFFDMVASLRAHASVLFVSHRLTEVLEISDRILVLRDGCLVADLLPAETSQSELHQLMVGRERLADYYYEQRQVEQPAAPVRFAARRLSYPGAFDDITLQVRAGEVLGLGGLLASGKEALVRALAGLLPVTQGHLEIDGEAVPRADTGRLVAKGLGYVPAERLTEGLIADFPVAWNISLASGTSAMAAGFGLWRTGAEHRAATESIARLDIRGGTPARPCRTLSGGNQQKVVLARWLLREPKVLVLDNPTRGIDAGGKAEIYAVLRNLTEQGVAILLVSDELLELIGLSNRIAIMQRGRIAHIVQAPVDAKPDEETLIRLMLQDVPGRGPARPADSLHGAATA